MDDQTEKHLGMTTSLPVQHSFSNNSALTENERKLMLLLKLGAHYWRDMTAGQAREFLADYMEDLANISSVELAAFCSSWRTNADNKRFPRSGEIIRTIDDDKRPRERLKTFKGIPPMDGPRATKSAAQILAEHGFSMPTPKEPPPLPFATDINGPVTQELKDSELVRSISRQSNHA